MLLLICCVSPSYASESVVSRIIVETPNAELAGQAREVITLKEGAPFSDGKLSESLELLERWGRFESVNVDREFTKDGWVVKFSLVPALIISGIDFKGHFPYLTSRIRRNVGIRVGQVYNRESVIDEVKKVKRFFEKEGYFATTVRVKEEVNAKRGVVLITFKIKKGPRLKWRKIEVVGNELLPDGFFRSKINTWFPYKPARLRASIDKMKDVHKKKGYPKTRIKVSELGRDFKNSKADIVLEVSEGKRLRVRFVGNKMVRLHTLRKGVTFFREEAYDSWEINESVKAIKDLYLGKGFLDVEVRAERDVSENDGVLVTFFIKEGRQALVKDIEIVGNDRIKDEEILKELKLEEAGPFVSGYLSMPLLDSDKKRIPYILNKNGFPDGSLKETRIEFNRWHDRARIVFEIEEGTKNVVGRINFVSARGAVKTDELVRNISLKTGNPFSEFLLKSDVQRLKDFFANRGFPYAEVEPFMKSEAGSVEVEFRIDEGPLVRIGEILIIGIDHTRSSTIRSVLSMKKGDVYNLEKILEGESDLRELGSFVSVDVEVLGLEERLEVVQILVKVEERKHFVFDVKASYSTDDSIGGTLSFTNLDIMGFGKRLSTTASAGMDLRRGEINYTDPHLLGSDFEIILGSFIKDEDRPSFRVTEAGASISFLRELTRNMSILTKYEVQRSILGGIATSSSSGDQTLPHGSLSFNYDSRDYYADPTRGMAGSAFVSYYHPFFGVGSNFLKVRGQFIYYKSPFRWFTFVNSIRSEGLVSMTAATVIPTSELLFIGGDYSIRGFDQDHAGPLDSSGLPLGQRFTVLYNSELQFRVAGSIKVAAFFDTANAASRFSFSRENLRHGAGIGLRYITPVGPVRFDYGFALDPRPGEGTGRLHFTFGYVF